MNTPELTQKLFDEISALPMIDVHTHLVGGKLGARGLHDVLLYHWVVTDLYSAGCPSGDRLTQYPGWPTKAEGQARVKEAIPFLPLVRNTSNYWAFRTILADLYNWHEPLTMDNWKKLDDIISARADDRAWHHSILDKLNIKRTCTELARRENGVDDNRLQYSMEWGMFARCQWGVFDSPVYELERCWGNPPGSPAPIGGTREKSKKTIKTIDDVHAAAKHYVKVIPYDMLVSTAAHISTDIKYSLPTKDEMQKALRNRKNAGEHERNIYASYINEIFLSELEKHGDTIMFQFSFAAEPLPFETASRVNQESIRQVAELVSRHPNLRFQCFVASRHANQSLCTLARELPNFSLAGYWWHNAYPNTIRQIIYDRLDMLPLNKQVGFFSDAYALEWTYGKAVVARKQLAIVLAEKIEQGQYTYNDAIAIARTILFETPQTLNRMKPRVER
jgi:glucuronate isomerase